VSGARSTARSAALWLVLSVAALLPFLLAALPPLYDYYHWVFEGRLFSSLAFGSGGAVDEAIADAYGIRSVPVPNAAATVVLGLLNLALPPLIAGRVFAACCALAFALGFAFLTRSIQRRPSVAELLGFPWAFAYFFYKGYLSYVLSVALSFVAIGALLRASDGGRRAPRPLAIAALFAGSVVLFLCHLVGWAFLLASALLLALELARSDRRAAALLLAPFAPSLILPLWYVLGGGGGRDSVYYASWGDKLRSLLEPWFLFVRTDPIPARFPVLGLSIGGLALLAALVLAQRGENPERLPARPLLLLAALLGAAALLLPYNNFMGMNRPDGRIIYPAVLIGLASIPYRRVGGRGLLLATATCLAILGLHAFEYAGASRYLERVEAGLEASLPEEGPGVSLAVILPNRESGCGGPGRLSLGRSDTLRWFGLVPLMDSEGARVSLMATSLVEKHFDHDDFHDLKSVVVAPELIPELVLRSRDWARHYTYVEIFGCPRDAERASLALAPYFDVAGSGPGYAVLHPAAFPPESRD